MQLPISIGTDIGGTHITCAAVEIREGRLLKETMSRTTYHHEAPALDIIHAWAESLNATLSKVDESELAGIGFAIPGPFEYRNGISKMEHKFKNLFGLHIPTALNPLLNSQKDLTMRFLNDASAFAVGEAWMGEGRNFQKVVVATLGTGLGSAFVLEGIPVVSGEQVPKEGCLWHLPFKDGIADDYFSTRWFIGEYKHRTGQNISGVKELMDRVDTDTVAKDLFFQFGENLADCLALPLKTFGAEVLILGGNISNALPLFGDKLRTGLTRAGVQTQITVSKLQEDAALIGSARLLNDHFWNKVSEQLPNI